MADELSPADTSAVVSADAKDAFRFVQLASTDVAGVVTISMFRHAACRAGYQAVIFGRDSEVSIIVRLPVVDPVFRFNLFESECLGSVSMDSPVPAVDMDRDVVDPPELSEVVGSEMAMTTSRFSPLNPRRSSVLSVSQIVVESLMSNEAPVGFTDECPTAVRAGPLLPQESQVSQWSSVQLSPNRVREYYDFDTLDVLPMYAVSPRNYGYFPSVSPISSPNAMNTPDSQTVL